MAANANVMSTKLIAILTLGTRSVKVGYVDQTDVWKMIALSTAIQQKFKEVTEKNLSTLEEDTDMVALQETPHPSESDDRTHLTAVEINGQGNVSAKRHFSVD
uniref:Uncharacterized protein n=1 Tax=Coccidioides posadasii RMSCC 3488 TaxID=454284 RepID=A0A0J6FAY5_COCPO|nr:hypothetical protein CPAG_06478 [Coccidioides posadasii RMSCC 3488]